MSGRPPQQQTAILRRLRKLAWRRGERLPSVRQLAQEFHASTRTVQRALQQLKQEGLIQGRAGVATFMLANQPVPERYALVVPTDPGDTSTLWSRFYATLVNEAPIVAQATHCQIIPFYGLDSGSRAADHARLAEWVEAGSLAGIIFASHPYSLIDSPILEKPGIPRVALMYPQLYPQVPVVSLQGAFFAKAFAWFAARRRRKLAVLMQWDILQKRNLVAEAADHGLELRSEWLLPMSSHLLEAAQAYVRLLLRGPKTEWPEALLIGDDNYVESVLAGLKAAGAQLGRDLDVVTHCNFPWAGVLPPQVQKLGYHAREVLETCLRLLERQRTGDQPPAVTTITAKFGEEMDQQLTSTSPTAALVETGEPR